LNEILYVNFNIDGFDGESRTKLFYDLTTTYFINNGQQNTNLTEGLYLNDIYDNTSIMTIDEAKQLDPVQANQNKYDKCFRRSKFNGRSRNKCESRETIESFVYVRFISIFIQ
jgi:hypothetical protein